MRVLFLSQAHVVADQQGYHDALLAAMHEGIISDYQNIPYLGYAKENGWARLWQEVVGRCKQHASDLVFFQFYHGEVRSAGNCLSQLKAFAQPPVIALSCGDAHTGRLLARLPQQEFVELSVGADVTFLTSTGSFADYLAKSGAKRLTLVPHAFSNDVFEFPAEGRLSESKEFDVVFVGSCPCTRNPLNVWVKRYAARRRRIVDRLYKRYGKRLGLFGHGWKGCPAWQGPIGFREQQSAYWRGNLVVDAAAPFNETYYASDRPFYVAGSGVPLVQHYTPRFDSIFAGDRHAYYVYQDADIVKVCDKVIDMDAATRLRRARETIDLVRERHLNRHRMRDMLLTCARIHEARKNNRFDGLADRIPMGHFLPEVDRAVEKPYALVNW